MYILGINKTVKTVEKYAVRTKLKFQNEIETYKS